jgi:outer membrane protein
MKKLLSLTCATLLALPAVSTADVLSFAIGGGIWKEDPSGYFTNADSTGDVNVKDNLGWKEEDQGYWFATLEHPVPILPNVRILNTSLDHSGTGFVDFTIDGVNFNDTVNSTGSFDQTDITAYWEVLDNVVSLDLGLTAKLIDFSYSIAGTTTPEQTSGSLSGTIPMVYGLLGVSPIPGLYLGVEGNFIGYDGNDFTDVTAKISYTTDFFLGIEGGYRSQSYKIDDIDGYFGKLEFEGPFLGAYLKF